MNKKRNISIWVVATGVIFIAVNMLSLFPLPELPDMLGNDKTGHLLAYAALSFPVSYARPKYFSVCLVAFVLWGGVIEIIQPYVNRYGEWLDFGANTTGVILGFVTALVIRKLIAQRSIN